MKEQYIAKVRAAAEITDPVQAQLARAQMQASWQTLITTYPSAAAEITQQYIASFDAAHPNATFAELQVLFGGES